MSFPFRSDYHPSTFNRLVECFRATVERFPDERTGDNVEYSMADVAIGAFSVFFTQSPWFLDAQRNLEVTQGRSNAQSLFGMTRTPSDNHIRNLLDPVPPETVFPGLRERRGKTLAIRLRSAIPSAGRDGPR